MIELPNVRALLYTGKVNSLKTLCCAICVPQCELDEATISTMEVTACDCLFYLTSIWYEECVLENGICLHKMCKCACVVMIYRGDNGAHYAKFMPSRLISFSTWQQLCFCQLASTQSGSADTLFNRIAFLFFFFSSPMQVDIVYVCVCSKHHPINFLFVNHQ